MRIKPSKASRHLLKNPYFELVYREAVANALDANATEVRIEIHVDAFSKPETLRLKISDNGDGFTDANYRRFSELLDAGDKSHKGLGRLAYMYYFDSVKVDSWFDGNKSRSFVFNDDFEQDVGIDVREEKHSPGTIFTFGSFLSKKFWSRENVDPKAIGNLLLREFLPRLYEWKQKRRGFKIYISLEINEPSEKLSISSGEFLLDEHVVPPLETREYDINLGILPTHIKLLYSVTKEGDSKASIGTALCVDGRTISQDLVKSDRLPDGVQALFILESSWVEENARADDARQTVEYLQDYESTLKRCFRENVSRILDEKIPEIRVFNERVKQELESRYPHYLGLFEKVGLGLVDSNKAVEDARDKFFRAQRRVLEAEKLTDERYDLALEQASRVLTEYVLYRNLIIQRMSEISSVNLEADIHNLIVPKRLVQNRGSFVDNPFQNNAWLLDDKFMTFSHVLSERKLSELLDYIAEHSEKNGDDDRPDIAFVFSDDIDSCNHSVDVVIVELKRRGIEHKEAYSVIEQMTERARRLLDFYPNKIQRMWFFGVIDIDEDMEFTLVEKSWNRLYSKGPSYYKQEDVMRKQCLPDGSWDRSKVERIPVLMNVISFDGFVKDAFARNQSFMELLKGQIRRFA